MSSSTFLINRLLRVTIFKPHLQTCFYWTLRTSWAMLSSKQESSDRLSRNSISRELLRTSFKSNCTKPSQRRLWSQQISLDLRPNREHKKSMAMLLRIFPSNYRIYRLSQMRKGSNRFLWICSLMHSNLQRKEAQSTFHASSSNVFKRGRNSTNLSLRENSTILFHQGRTVTSMSI